MKKQGLLYGAIGVLAIGQAFMHRSVVYPFWEDHYKVQTSGALSELRPDQMLASMAGFREMVAGILWVRADSFFDVGNYDAILPIIRIVTILDPKQIDVYATGMWHIGYNFTDEESRSDRRYIPSALALGKEGAKNNDYTYELFFETGWMWFHKIDDEYGHAVKWLSEAGERDDMKPARKNLLWKAMVRDGQIEETVDYLSKLMADAEAEVKKNPNDFQSLQMRDTRESNLDNHLVRMAQRGYFAQKGGYYDQGEYDTKPPFNVGFTARVTVVDAKVLLVEGTWNVRPVGTRIRCILRDADYPNATPGGMDWDMSDLVNLDPPRDLTFMMDQLFVRDQQFSKRIDMSRDPTMYPFTKDEYVLEFYYNPRSAPDHIQDKFGFNGEGMTDPNHLNTEIREGQRVIFATMTFSRDELLRRGEYEIGGQTPVKMTKGFAARRPSDLRSDIIEIPGLQGGGGR